MYLSVMFIPLVSVSLQIHVQGLLSYQRADFCALRAESSICQHWRKPGPSRRTYSARRDRTSSRSLPLREEHPSSPVSPRPSSPRRSPSLSTSYLRQDAPPSAGSSTSEHPARFGNGVDACTPVGVTIAPTLSSAAADGPRPGGPWRLQRTCPLCSHPPGARVQRRSACSPNHPLSGGLERALQRPPLVAGEPWQCFLTTRTVPATPA